MYFTTVTGHSGVPCFLRNALVIPLVNFQKCPKRERQDSYPGNDANEEAPVGYFVTKYTRYTRSVRKVSDLFFMRTPDGL